MNVTKHKMIRLGDLVVAVFDEATQYSADPQEVSRLATQTVVHILRTAIRKLAPLPAEIVLNETSCNGKPVLV